MSVATSLPVDGWVQEVVALWWGRDTLQYWLACHNATAVLLLPEEEMADEGGGRRERKRANIYIC